MTSYLRHIARHECLLCKWKVGLTLSIEDKTFIKTSGM